MNDTGQACQALENILTHLDATAAEPQPHGGRHAVRCPSEACSIDREYPTTTTRGCDVCGAALSQTGPSIYSSQCLSSVSATTSDRAIPPNGV